MGNTSASLQETSSPFLLHVLPSFFPTKHVSVVLVLAKVLLLQKELVVRYTELNTLFTTTDTRLCCSQCSIPLETNTFSHFSSLLDSTTFTHALSSKQHLVGT
jgi:hypothetical protein